MEKKRYIWKVGILGWGLPVFVVITAVYLSDIRHLTLSSVIFAILLGLLVSCAGGAILAAFAWNYWKIFRR